MISLLDLILGLNPVWLLFSLDFRRLGLVGSYFSQQAFHHLFRVRLQCLQPNYELSVSIGQEAGWTPETVWAL
jgi:hypothetical protein